MFEGAYTALVTSFKEGNIDKEAYKRLIELQIAGGVDGIVPCGCTGEAATMTHEEQLDLIEFTVGVVNKRIKVLAGTGSNSTKEACKLTKAASKLGCDGALLITPYYNKPTQEGLFRHYELIAKESGLPICLYNVPGRTGVSIAPETVARLNQINNIVAIKEASGSLDQVNHILQLCDIEVLSGDDPLTLPMMVLGAKGVISVAANVIPEDVSKLVHGVFEGNMELAQTIHKKMWALNKAFFIETNPIPVKTALQLMGLLNGELRLPLCEAKPATKTALAEALSSYGLEVVTI